MSPAGAGLERSVATLRHNTCHHFSPVDRLGAFLIPYLSALQHYLTEMSGFEYLGHVLYVSVRGCFPII